METLRCVSLRILKQGFISFVIFNIFNISFSLGIHFKYYSVLDTNFITGAIFGFVLIIAAVIGIIVMYLK